MTYAIRYGVAGLIRPSLGPSKARAPIPPLRGPNRATLLHGSCTRARLARAARVEVAVVVGAGHEAELQPAQRLERRVHPDELPDEALCLLGDPPDLLTAHRLEGPRDAIMEGQQLGDVLHAALPE